MFSDLEKTKSKFQSIEKRVTGLASGHNYISHKASSELKMTEGWRSEQECGSGY